MPSRKNNFLGFGSSIHLNAARNKRPVELGTLKVPGNAQGGRTTVTPAMAAEYT